MGTKSFGFRVVSLGTSGVDRLDVVEVIVYQDLKRGFNYFAVLR